MRLAGLLRQLPYFYRTLKVAVACLLLSHAVAHSQNTAAPATVPGASAATNVITLPKTIPFKQDSALASAEGGPSFAGITLVVVIGLAGFSLWVWRQRRRAAGVDNIGKRFSWWSGASSTNVLLHGTTRLSPKHSVHDIEWRGRRLLIGCTDQAMTLLSEHAVAESPAAAGLSHPIPGQPEGAS